jgi:quercetin dioxygenase-like cupin family protein
MMQGELTYYLGDGKTKSIHAGQIDVASKNDIHGCINEGKEDAIFCIHIFTKNIGFQAAQK